MRCLILVAAVLLNFQTMLIPGPEALSNDRWLDGTWEDNTIWVQRYFGDKEQWWAQMHIPGPLPDGQYQIATYETGLTAADFGPVEYMVIEDILYVDVQILGGAQPPPVPVPEPGATVLLLAAGAMFLMRPCRKFVIRRRMLLVVVGLVGTLTAASLVAEDLSHDATVDYEFDFIGVSDHSGPNPPTVVNFVEPAVGNHVSVSQASIANFNGGVFGSISCSDSSVVNLTGGSADFLWASHEATVNISGGDIDRLLALDSTNVDVSGGHFGMLVTGESGIVNITAGRIRELGVTTASRANLFGGAVESPIDLRDGIVNIFGGTISGIDASVLTWGDRPTPNPFTKVNIFDVVAEPTASGNSRLDMDDGWMNIFGGTIGIPVVTRGQGISHIRGGSFSDQFEVTDDATMHIYGYGLDLTDDRLTGTLSDGSPLDVPAIANLNGRYVLHEVPEPGVTGMLLVGLATFGLFWRRRSVVR